MKSSFCRPAARRAASDFSSSAVRSLTRASRLSFVTAKEMITWTGEGEGVQVASGLADRTIEVEVLDVKHDIASVLVRSEPYHEYLHLVRTGDGWKVANALWCTP